VISPLFQGHSDWTGIERDRHDAPAAKPDVTSQPDLAALVEAVARHRDRVAFTALFDHFAPRLNGFLLRQGCDPALAEEIVQDTLATLWRKAALFDPAKSTLSTWLYRIARNRRIDLARRDRSDRIDPEDPILHPPPQDEPDRLIDAQRRQETLRQALESLPEEQLELVRLAFFEGLSHAQVAERTRLPLGTVKSRIRLAFSRLRRALEADGVVEAG
jgi:RNA polymerase sigma-70 factor (ECF subfamily)